MWGTRERGVEGREGKGVGSEARGDRDFVKSGCIKASDCVPI